MTCPALTVFLHDGHLFQVEYALVAVRKGTCNVGICGKNVIVLGVEKKLVLQLQDPQTIRKLAMLDNHVCLAFAGAPDIRSHISIDKAQIECHSHSTQSGGGPFDISTFIVGFNPHDTKPHPMTKPSGICSA
ncbi:nucleophile aminohydrolase [Lentinula lateritia]|nr:nucleophile aminohydrolase [Lentinula lateritia]